MGYFLRYKNREKEEFNGFGTIKSCGNINEGK